VVGGYLYAQLVDDTFGAVYTFCLKVEAGSLFITVPSLEFKICTSATITPAVAII